jgi:glutamyl-tRNA synthetase
MGGVRTALFNFLYARKNKGVFVLRIEDTDQTRFVERAEEYIKESLEWSGMIPDESPWKGGGYGPYRQSERKEIYKPYAQQLIDSGRAYYAFDTPQELDEMREAAAKSKMPNWQYNHVTRQSMKNSLTLSKDEVQRRIDSGEPYVIRIKMERNEEIRFHDAVRGWVVVQSNSLDDKVLFKSDGMPTYHLANVVDDHLMKISHVIRGEEWLPSAPLHIKLYEALGWTDETPVFAHLPLILRPDGKGKLSKRDGDQLGIPVFPLNWTTDDLEEIRGYRESGFFPEAFINILAFLGWNPGTTQEIFSMNELIESFSLERVGKSGAKFDVKKAFWYNQQYLKETPNEDLAKLLIDDVEKINHDVDIETLAIVCGMMKERAVFPHEIISEGKYFFIRPSEYDEKTHRKKWKENTPEILKDLKRLFADAEDFSSKSVEEIFKSYLEEKAIGFGSAGPALRLVLTGKGMGPSLFDIASFLGKKETVARIDLGIEKLS